MRFIRIGEKLLSLHKLQQDIEEMLDLRVRGFSQQDVAQRFELDRSFISRLEKLGEVRKGKKIAVIGFPILNKAELLEVCREESVDYALLLKEEERWDFLQSRSGVDLFNQLMQIIAQVREHNVVILLASDKRAKLVRGLLEGEIMQITLGPSPLSEDRYVEPEQLRNIILRAKEDVNEKSS